MKKIPLYLQILLAFFVILLLATLIRGNSTFKFSEIIAYVTLIISVFSFGLYMVFSMENRRDRMNSIKKSLRDQDAKLFNLYQLSKYFSLSFTNAMRNQIDQYLIAQIDWTIEDIGNSSRNLSYIFDLVQQLKPKGSDQKMAKEKMLDNLQEVSSILKEVSFQAKSKMSVYEWASLLALFCIILFVIFHENIGSFVSILIISLISSALVLSLLILRELDALQWQEQKWIWEPLTELFRDLDLVPYFPNELFLENRVSIKKIEGLTEARIAYCKYPYPNFKGKKIKLVHL
ncbi:MAG: hypothetical protein WC858_02405 [Parcubacteria group bacterium]|jgi:hypothetical protein